MSLDKAIDHNKEHRKPYRGAKAIDCSCRNHGTCEWYKTNRLKDMLMNEIKYKQALEDIKDYAV